MMCPECGFEKTMVKKTAGTTNEYSIDRWRKCQKCNNSFKTVEKVVSKDELQDIVFNAVTVAINQMFQNQNTSSDAPQHLISRQMPCLAMAN